MYAQSAEAEQSSNQMTERFPVLSAVSKTRFAREVAQYEMFRKRIQRSRQRF